MPSIEDLVINGLDADPYPIWPTVWRTYTVEAMSWIALQRLDLRTGTLASDWSLLDDPLHRGKVIPRNAAAVDRCTDLIADSKPWRERLNVAITAGGLYHAQNTSSLKQKLRTVIPSLINRPETTLLGIANPFPEVWEGLGVAIARAIHQQNHPIVTDGENVLLTKLLLAAFFRACRLPGAAKVLQVFNEAIRGPLELRGSFVRITEIISPEGIVDPPPPREMRSGGVHLATAHLSAMLGNVEAESQQVALSNGFMHRIRSIHTPSDVPAEERGSVSDAQLAEGRDASFKLYEYTVLGYMALACIEQLARAWAAHIGQPHLKVNDHPLGVSKWAHLLPCSVALRDRLKALFGHNGPNVRNRIMHGGLLEINTKRLEVHLPIVEGFRSAAPLAEDRDVFSAENIAQYCLSHLEQLDSELAGVGLIPADLHWTARLAPSAQELQFGNALNRDLVGPDALAWQAYSRNYLRLVFPALKQLYTIGFLGWTDRGSPDSSIRLMGLSIVFEALYRLTSQWRGVTVLQAGPKAGNYLHVQYHMLDETAAGLATEPALDAVLDCLDAPSRGVAKRVLRLAVKARNSLSHGAFIALDRTTVESVGYVFLKAIQALICSGIHQMTREAAYARWTHIRGRDSGYADQDWAVAERDVLGKLQVPRLLVPIF